MPSDWKCDWVNLLSHLNPNDEGIIKMVYNKQLIGLMKISFYPAQDNNISNPDFLEISNIEAKPIENRKFNPVGFWLIWYACQMAFLYCKANGEEDLITLDSLEDAMTYYEDQVMMEPLGWATIAPGEDGYAFRFTRKGAASFCSRIENRYGKPVRI
jgi:hypothetical protein